MAWRRAAAYLPPMTAPAFARPPRRALIRVSGPEARPFLNRLLTQEVETLGEAETRFAALLTPQGRLLADMFVHGAGEAVLLDVAAEARDPLLLRLGAYRLRAAVTVAADPGEVWALWGVDRAPAGWRADPRTPLAGFRAVGTPPPWPEEAEEAGAEEAGAGAYLAHRLALGLPDAQEDGLVDRAYATEALLDLLNGADFRKGCFVGQETTSRMKRRGGVRSRVLPLAVEGAGAGAEVLAGERRAGEVVGAGQGRALALLRLDRLEGPLAIEGRPARVERPAWWPAGEPPFA